jgi:tRNA-intron endonuclease
MHKPGNNYVISDEPSANSIHSKGSIGLLVKNKLELSPVEALYLLKKNKIIIKKTTESLLIRKASRSDKRFLLRFKVFEDLRSKGYVVKTALKYGFDYRVYGKGKKPGKAHAKWLVHAFSENEKYSWKDYSKMMRIAHSVKKTTLIAIVDDEGDTTYWESGWKKL